MSNENLIHCERHGRQRWYIICRHVVDGAEPAHFVECTETQPGECLCASCLASKPSVETVRMICEPCLCVLAQNRLNKRRRLKVHRSWHSAKFKYGVPN